MAAAVLQMAQRETAEEMNMRHDEIKRAVRHAPGTMFDNYWYLRVPIIKLRHLKVVPRRTSIKVSDIQVNTFRGHKHVIVHFPWDIPKRLRPSYHYPTEMAE